MDRRSFLKLFAAAGPVAAVAPTYFFAPVGGWKSELIVHPADPTSCESVAAAQEVSLYFEGLQYWQDDKHVGSYSGIDRQPFVVIEQEMSVEEALKRFPPPFFTSLGKVKFSPFFDPEYLKRAAPSGKTGRGHSI